MDLSAMSLNELRRLQSKVGSEISRRDDLTRRNLLKKMKKMAAEEGLSLTDVIGAKSEVTAAKAGPGAKRGPKSAKKKTPLPAKYHHPENPEIGWSGRGRRPQWVIDWLAQNKPLEELAKQ